MSKSLLKVYLINFFPFETSKINRSPSLLKNSSMPTQLIFFSWVKSLRVKLCWWMSKNDSIMFLQCAFPSNLLHWDAHTSVESREEKCIHDVSNLQRSYFHVVQVFAKFCVISQMNWIVYIWKLTHNNSGALFIIYKSFSYQSTIALLSN